MDRFFIENASILAQEPTLNGVALPIHAADDQVGPKGHRVNAIKFTGLRGVVRV
jgi:hypothetical protein